ncbi:MAG: hypothetical protein Q4G71_05515 [Pseudomonadota bacterium]|nr:hypothetical protein [Pseudomonadota bacterium]
MRQWTWARCAAVLWVGAGGMAAVQAQTFPMYSSVAWSMSNSAGNAILSQNTLREAAKAEGRPMAEGAPLFDRSRGAGKAPAGRAPRAVSTAIAKPGGTRGIESLVAGYPAAQKAEMRKVFTQLIAAFEPVAGQLGAPAYDMGSAAAALISGSYAAYHNQTLSEAHFRPLARQMQRAFESDAGFSRMSTAEKQNLYQIMVGAGMLFTVVQLENAKQPNPEVTAQLRAAGGDFLGQFTHSNPALVRLGDDGLRMP